MFEAMEARAARLAHDHAEARRREIEQRLAALLPPGIDAAASGEGVGIEGRGLSRRLALDARLRWLLAEVLK